jgi:nitrogen-specific signal transduction histidine kinase
MKKLILTSALSISAAFVFAQCPAIIAVSGKTVVKLINTDIEMMKANSHSKLLNDSLDSVMKQKVTGVQNIIVNNETADLIIARYTDLIKARAAEKRKRS